jgi:ankyrin repeat protein
MLRYFYDLDPMSPCATGMPSMISISNQTEPSAKLKHIVHLYAAADKYDAPVLRKNILSSFMTIACEHWLALWNSGELPDIIEAIYAFAVRKDCLRNAAVELSLEHINKFRESDVGAFQDLLETVPDFGADIFMQIPLPNVKIPLQFLETQPLVEVLTAHSDQFELHEAAKLGDLARCKTLIWTGTYVSALDVNDSTPLHFAAFYGRMPIVRFLVENAHADVNACCDN